MQSTPVVLGWTCNMVRFDIPGFTSLGEHLVNQGASAGVFSATGWSHHGLSDELRAAFSAVAFGSDAETIGDAMIWAHRAASEAPLAVHRVYMLLGDPALRLRAPKARPAPEPGPEPDPIPGPESVGPLRSGDGARSGASGCSVSSSDSTHAPVELALTVCALAFVLRSRSGGFG
jgi:hypothetical protein